MEDELSLEDIEALFAEPEPRPQLREVSRKPANLICICGQKRDENGYCQNPDCEVDAPIQTYECGYCGHCATPNKCIASVTCPRCNAEPRELCRDDRGAITGYHEDRWLYLQETHGNYYK